MNIAITHCYIDESAWGDVIDTDKLPLELSQKMIAMLKKKADIELSYQVMQNELIHASVKTYPCTVHGTMTVYEG